jgi:hypothetical protein
VCSCEQHGCGNLYSTDAKFQEIITALSALLSVEMANVFLDFDFKYFASVAEDICVP